jgi:hypothetical protein
LIARYFHPRAHGTERTLKSRTKSSIIRPESNATSINRDVVLHPRRQGTKKTYIKDDYAWLDDTSDNDSDESDDSDNSDPSGPYNAHMDHYPNGDTAVDTDDSDDSDETDNLSDSDSNGDAVLRSRVEGSRRFISEPDPQRIMLIVVMTRSIRVVLIRMIRMTLMILVQMEMFQCPMMPACTMFWKTTLLMLAYLTLTILACIITETTEMPVMLTMKVSHPTRHTSPFAGRY